ncbi:MAG: ATP-dependent Clp protease ATP-binding subunit ClpA [Rickettsiales bacterium]|nr:ATP-dependent Clp protease ATP-binding subunit ClpA [Rickettsiales bacterium]OUV80288.1 MAG: ATP-dependent Clp protease ATP-binding subunit ClpA [Rickettsiales bacterium TMED131]|tara:strand:- start:142 stop:2367 length:2226 start_codon:yes stop_codon:yes gene_type:complete
MISEQLEIIIQKAFDLAKRKKHEFLTLEHLLFELCNDHEVLTFFKTKSINTEAILKDLEVYIEKKLKNIVVNEEIKPIPSMSFERVLKRAAQHVQSSRKGEVKTLNILVAMFSERDSFAVYFLEKQNLSRLDIVSYVSHEKNKSNFQEGNQTSKDDDNLQEDSNSILEKYCINLNKKAIKGTIDPLIGRETEIERTIQILCRRLKNNPLFVGDPGVGKTALAEGLAKKIVEGKVPSILKDVTIYTLEMATLLAGTRYRGDFEERLNNILKKITSDKNNVLFIDEIHTVIGAGATSGGSIDASNILKPALANGTLRCIGSTTYSEFRKYFEKDSALVRRFQKVDINEPSEEEAILIIKGIIENFENFHNVKYDIDVIVEAVRLSAKFIHGRKLPDKAIDVIDEIGAKHNLSKIKRKINVKDVEDIIAKIAKIPSKNISADDSKVLSNLKRNLKLSIFGQDNAVDELVRVVKLSRSGLRDDNKTIGSYLFVGPTGVGKTEIAKVLSSVLNIDLLRFDMSEYMERHSISRLIGSPPGYVGFDEGGALTEAVNKSPNSIVLLDEIEKAHPDIFNILLQIMDYGKLTDHNSRTVDFRNTILIMTSNVGAEDLEKNSLGFTAVDKNKDNDIQINKMFAPEFRNRLDSIIKFEFLSKKVMKYIVDKAINILDGQLSEKNISIVLSNSAKEHLIDEGYDSKFGARPLERVVQKKIKEPLADDILFGKLKKGGTVKIDFIGGKLKISVSK